MPVLRSREISPKTAENNNNTTNTTNNSNNNIIDNNNTTVNNTNTNTNNNSNNMEPNTPAKIEPVTGCRRSPRFASPVNQLNPATVTCRKRKSPVNNNILSEKDAENVGGDDGQDEGTLSLRSGKRIVKPVVAGDKEPVRLGISGDEVKARIVRDIKIEEEVKSESIALLDVSGLPGSIGLEEVDRSLSFCEAGTVGNSKRKFSRVEEVKVENVAELNQGQMIEEDTGTGMKTRRRWKELKGKEMVVEDELLLNTNNISPCTTPMLDNLGPKELGKEPTSSANSDVKVRSPLTREDKGKDKVVEDGSSTVSLAGNTSIPVVKDESDVVVNNPGPVLEDVRNDVTNARGRGFKERFRDIARKNASRFAHFSSQEPEENHVNHEPVIEREVEAEREVEEWPGPFSTAMRIIRDRESNVPMAQQNSASNSTKTGSIKWVPKKDKSPQCSVQSIPKLQDLCMDILAKNAEAISSLESVPDVIRHKLSHMLCDSRKMNAQFLDLLVCGSPTEIRIRDCSWLTEEEFTKAFKSCETSLLMVLQLDQCGRCLPDYLLSETLASSLNVLPVLTTMSIKGACRLSDAGLSVLVASAPALRSINLSQCSLLSCDGINTLANSLGSVLRELYLDDCQNIDPMLILPALLKLEQLEVLSLAGNQTVSDVLISELVAVRGQNLKELVLTDCTQLTDSSLKAVAETCTGLRALDLSNLCRLTDFSLGYLANGCRTIERLKFSRNAFSDEAIAAYLEASGGSLKELSLNNIRKVGDDAAISLARCCRNLTTLDLSWCRNLTDEALGLIVDSCLSLKLLKLFGCTQITNVFVDGHSNPQLQIVGLKMTPILKHLKVSEPQQGLLHYSAI